MANEVLDVFLFNNKLRFSEIEKILKIRSNKLAYYLRDLVDRGILRKEGEFYRLSESSEFLIPYLSEKRSPLPVILICIGNSKRCFLYSRGKRPFKDKLSLPGGRLIVNESISNATKRIMKEKFGIDAKLEKINSISLEHVKKSGKIVHSFLLIFVLAKTKRKIALVDVEKNRSKIIASDYKLIKNCSKGKEVELKTIYSRD